MTSMRVRTAFGSWRCRDTLTGIRSRRYSWGRPLRGVRPPSADLAHHLIGFCPRLYRLVGEGTVVLQRGSIRERRLCYLFVACGMSRECLDAREQPEERPPAAESCKHEGLAPSVVSKRTHQIRRSGHGDKRRGAMRHPVSANACRSPGVRRRGNAEVGRAGCAGRKGEARRTQENRRRSADLQLQMRSFRSRLRQRNTARRFHTSILHLHRNRAASSAQRARKVGSRRSARNADARHGTNAPGSFLHGRFPGRHSRRHAKDSQALSHLQYPSGALRQREQELSAREKSRFSCRCYITGLW
jgi:hypothetical protein